MKWRWQNNADTPTNTDVGLSWNVFSGKTFALKFTRSYKSDTKVVNACSYHTYLQHIKPLIIVKQPITIVNKVCIKTMSVSLRLGESLVSGAVLGYTVTVLLYLYIVHNVCIQVFRPRVVITKQPSPILEIIHKSITNLFLTLYYYCIQVLLLYKSA